MNGLMGSEATSPLGDPFSHFEGEAHEAEQQLPMWGTDAVAAGWYKGAEGGHETALAEFLRMATEVDIHRVSSHKVRNCQRTALCFHLFVTS